MRLDPPEEVRLNEFSKVEVWDLARQTRPDLSFEEFEVIWEQHMAWKAARRFH
jgi:hypothetical protein